MEGIATFLLLSFALVSGENAKVISINDLVDKWCKDSNQNATLFNSVSLQLPETSLNGARLFNGTLFGLNSMERTGNCSLTTFRNGTSVKEVHVGLEFAVATFSRVVYRRQVNSAYLVFKRNSFFYKVSFNKDTCFYKILNYELEVLNWKSYEFPLSRRDTFSTLAFELNNRMNKSKNKLEKRLVKVCKEKQNFTSSFLDFPELLPFSELTELY